MEKWQTTNTKYIVKDRWLKLRADECLTPDGHTVSDFYVLEYPDWANCVVIDSSNQLIMIRQYRHGIDDFVPEFVAGVMDESDANHEETIKRELEEELGYTGGQVFQTGVSYPNPSSQTNKVYSFLAVGGECSTEQRLEASETLTVERLPLVEVIKNLSGPDSGVTYQSMHIASLFFALNFINHSSLEALKDIRRSLAQSSS